MSQPLNPPVSLPPLLDEPLLVVKSRPTFFGRNHSYEIYNQFGYPVGSVQEAGRQVLVPALMNDAHNQPKHYFQIFDAQRNLQLVVGRLFRVGTAEVIVMNPQGYEIGRISGATFPQQAQLNLTFTVSGQPVALMQGTGGLEWNFIIYDAHGTAIAHMNKGHAGGYVFGRGAADIFTVQKYYALPEPLRSLILATPFVMDPPSRRPRHGAR